MVACVGGPQYRRGMGASPEIAVGGDGWELRTTPSSPFDSARTRDRVDLFQRQAEATFRRTANVLRMSGRPDPARRVDGYAEWALLQRTNPDRVQRAHALAARLAQSSSRVERFDAALDGALSLMRADFGNLQLLYPQPRGLRIVAHTGFSQEFLEYFSDVDDAKSACGRAARSHGQVVIADVATDEAFADHRGIAAAAGFRAVQSTPVVDRSGRLVGVLSTHFRKRHHPSGQDLLLLAHYGRWIADHIYGNGNVVS